MIRAVFPAFNEDENSDLFMFVRGLRSVGDYDFRSCKFSVFFLCSTKFGFHWGISLNSTLD